MKGMDEQTWRETVEGLQAELSQLRARVADLEGGQLNRIQLRPSTSRRRLLKGLAVGLMVAGVGLAGPKGTVQARTLAQGNPGAVIVPNGKSVTPLPTETPYSYGLVVSTDTLDLNTDLAPNNTAVTGIGTGTAGIGLLGVSTDPTGIGVYGSNDAGIGVSGESRGGNGVFASSGTGVALQANSTDNRAVSGYSINGPALYGVSVNTYGGVFGSDQNFPLRLVPGGTGQPDPAKSVQVGAFWLNATGDLFVYTGATGWKRVMYY